MGRKAAILFSNFGPYHVARIEALRDALGQRGIELVAFRFTVGSDDYGWAPEDPKDVPVVTLAQSKPTSASEAFKMAAAFGRELRERKVDVVFLPTYSPLPNLLCFLAAKVSGCRTVLMTESWHGTEGASLPGKLIKHVLVRMFNSALVGGSPQRDYVVAYGMPRQKVFTGYDVVDVEAFAKRADEFRALQKRSQGSVVSSQQEVAGTELPINGLPERFFLNLGRFVEKKNLATLVSAYARYAQGVAVAGKKSKVKGNDVENQRDQETADGVDPHTGGQAAAATKGRRGIAALVLVGEGPLRGDLERQARDLGLPVRDGVVDPISSGGAEVVFYPFQQADLTPLFFALCEAFVLPSKREEWGLVVNEAMACGAPVVVSNRVGSHFDLVRDGENGFVFAPDDVEQLAGILHHFDEDPELSRRLGTEGCKAIQAWTPALFGSAGAQALKAAAG
jgi:glycosyltransferase involved in cell wall biosynthesis